MGCISAFFLSSSAYIYFTGIRDSQSVQEMIVKLNYNQLPTGWHPTDTGRVDRYLEARIVGEERWWRNAVAMEEDDLVEVRLVIASENSDDANPVAIAEQISLRQSSGLDFVLSEALSHDVASSPDPEHVACVSIGVIGFDQDSHGTRTLEVGYGQEKDESVKILLVPPYSELSWSELENMGVISGFFLTLTIGFAISARKSKAKGD